MQKKGTRGKKEGREKAKPLVIPKRIRSGGGVYEQQLGGAGRMGAQGVPDGNYRMGRMLKRDRVGWDTRPGVATKNHAGGGGGTT